MYTEKELYEYSLNQSYETITQDLTQDTGTINLDTGNVLGVLVDGVIDVLDASLEDGSLSGTNGTTDTTDTKTIVSCDAGYTLKDGVCVKIDSNKDWLKWLIIGVVIFIGIYAYYKYYGK